MSSEGFIGSYHHNLKVQGVLEVTELLKELMGSGIETAPYVGLLGESHTRMGKQRLLEG